MTDAVIPGGSAPWRWSHFKAFGRSGAHGRHARIHEEKPNQAMERGVMVHAIISGRGKFVAYPGPVRRGKEYDAFAEKHADATILTQTDYDLSMRAAEAIMANQDAAPYLQGAHEQTLFFDYYGFKCRATPDIRGADFLCEIKSTANASEAFWAWHHVKMGYNSQMWMQNIAAANHGHAIKRHVIIAVEQKPPHVVMVYELTERALEMGNKRLVLCAETARACVDGNTYPGYRQGVVPLEAPVTDELDLNYGDDE